MNLFVFGVGYTAGHFIHEYRRRFTRVCGTVRSPEPEGGGTSRADLRTYHFDGSDYDSRILDELAEADALLVSVPPAAGADPVMERFADAIASARHLRWVGYLSTVGVYGDAGGQWVDEDTPPAPRGARSLRRLAAEQQWLELGRRSRAAVHVFRLAGIYGPGRNALRRIVDGTARRIVKPGQVFNRIHVSDIAQVLMASIERPHSGTFYNVADDEPGPPQDVIAYAAELLGREPPPEVPFAEADLEPMARSFYEDNKRVRNTRIKEELGVTLRFPTYRHGLDALVASGEGLR